MGVKNFIEFVNMKKDYLLTYTFKSKSEEDKSDEFFRNHFETKLGENKSFSNIFGPNDFDQTTIAFNSDEVNVGVVQSKLSTIISQLLAEYRKDGHSGYKYTKDCKLFLMYPKVDERHPKVAHIIIDDLSNFFEEANKQ